MDENPWVGEANPALESGFEFVVRAIARMKLFSFVTPYPDRPAECPKPIIYRP
jgi:hypothetical protein